MNTLSGAIVTIESSDALSLVGVDVGGDIFSCVVIDTEESARYLRIGMEVKVVFKETEVALARNLRDQISIRNHMHGPIIDIERGAILTKVRLKYKSSVITSVITTSSAKAMELKAGEPVIGLVKSNEVSLMR
ncbi:MAG TPA: TOBE domain-containing protein [Bacteroidota bacterium]|nr:TOBE domain-containing protein [Bacteroidota bacterium]